MKRRIYDISGVTDNKVSVYFNDEKIKIKSFNDYINLYGEIRKHMKNYLKDGNLL